MVDAATTPASTLGGVASLIQALAPIFLGGGKTVGSQAGQQQGTSAGTVSGTTAGTSGGTTTTTGTNVTGTTSPEIIASLIQQMNQAQANATDPTKVQAIIDNIIHQSTLAFAPTIGEASASGIYNSSTLGLLAGEANARATQEAAATALNFQTSEQQIANSIGANILGGTRTVTTGGTTDQQQQQQQQQQQATTGQTTAQTGQQTSQQTQPIVGSGSSNLLLAGAPLLATFALSKLGVTGADGLLSKLFGTNPTDAANPNNLSSEDLAVLNDPNIPPIPPDAGSVDVASSIAQGGTDVTPSF